ncbi:DNA/RNA non-specific endonuclease [Aquimarina sp. 2201CG5-10]|uniref:DNA/RNA non-specific endonuclease n=1 Tax=Aquimarina callyspongiae TaxID=3098150 RepID=UPI002AB34FBC|nr:DNA/RNA non-specific endonuclease [Aquimarina sp. 2201CG5-10]MDY8136808.1 DNA/RNA non-specific endonuclease [Aquimarina sp. 2201CG5-10]
MNRKYIYPLLIIIVTVGFYYLEEYLGDTQYTQKEEGINKDELLSFFYLPTSTTGAIVVHDFYALSYVEKHEQAEWVAYELKKEHLSQNEFKRPYFEEDKMVRTSSADWRNYKKSGYDRGHLCPAGDRRFSYKAYEETFLTSNVTPQNHQFNSGVWNKLEKKVRYWAKIYDGVYVVTGGVLSGNLDGIGYEQVSIPKYFYKVVLDKSDKTPKMIAFLMPHKESNASLKQFVVPVDEVEKLTGIDFFPKLGDDVEQKLESTIQTKKWKF